MTRAALAGLALVLVVGCSSTDGERPAPAATTAAPAPTSSPVQGTGDYATPEEVVEALGAGGLGCTSPEPVENEGVDAALRCVLEVDPLQDLIAVTFASPEQQAEFERDFADPLVHGVVGDGWAVVLPVEDAVQQVAEATGGSPR